MQRRDLLSAAELGDIFSFFGLSDELPADLTLLRTGRRAMATLFEIFLPFTLGDATQIAGDAFDLIDEVEDQLTVYRDNSEVAFVNQRASTEAVPVSANLFRLLEDCRHLTRETQGCFDVATGAMTKAWGFFRRSGQVPAVTERIAAMNRTGFQHVVLNELDRSVKFRVPGLELNFGGIGKGYALDVAADYLLRSGVLSALMHGGSSSIRALGCPAGQDRGWPIAVKHPWHPDRVLGTLWLKDGAMGTSAATFQFFEYNGKNLGHVLDPRKGWPAEGIASACVLARTAAEADALSTAMFVMGVEAAREYGRTHPEIAALILPDTPNADLIPINLPTKFASFRSN